MRVAKLRVALLAAVALLPTATPAYADYYGAELEGEAPTVETVDSSPSPNPARAAEFSPEHSSRTHCAAYQYPYKPYTLTGQVVYAEISTQNTCPDLWALHRVWVQRWTGSYWESLNPRDELIAPATTEGIGTRTSRCIGEYDTYRTRGYGTFPGVPTMGTKYSYSTQFVMDCPM